MDGRPQAVNEVHLGYNVQTTASGNLTFCGAELTWSILHKSRQQWDAVRDPGVFCA